MLMPASARIVDMTAKIPVKEKSSGPMTDMHDHPASEFSEITGNEEEQTIDSSSSVLLIL